MHLKGSPKGDAKVQEHLEDQAKVLILLYQVLRLGISAAGRNIVKNFPERNKCFKVALIVCYLIIGKWFKGRQYWA